MQEQSIFDTLQEEYNLAIQNQDGAALQNLLRSPVFESLKGNPELYVQGLKLRASAFTLFGELDSASEEYEIAFDYLDEDEDKWPFYLEWALLYMAELSIARGEAYRIQAMQKGIYFLDKGALEIEESAIYDRMTWANLKAFMLLQMGDREAAMDCYQDIVFEPVPIHAVNDPNELQEFFTHINKGLGSAIELQNLDLLMNMIRTISIDDESLSQEQTLFQLFNTTIGFLFELREDFAKEFNTLFRLKEKLAEGMPVYGQFLTLIGQQDFETLNSIFEQFHTTNHD